MPGVLKNLSGEKNSIDKIELRSASCTKRRALEMQTDNINTLNHTSMENGHSGEEGNFVDTARKYEKQ